MGGKSGDAPSPPDYIGAANEQARLGNKANRPTINTDFGTQKWQQNATGDWTLDQSLSQPFQQQLGGLQKATQGLLGGLDTAPLDYSGLSPLESGSTARNQAVKGAYNQAASRLDPQWEQRTNAARGDLLNQGLDPSSEAYQQQMGALGRERNDAYSSAMNNAIGQGTQAGSALFNQSLAGRQQGLSELLRQREVPMQQLSQLMGAQQGLGGMFQAPHFGNSGLFHAPDLLGATEALGNSEIAGLRENNAATAQNNSTAAGVASAAGTALMALLAFL